MSYEPCPNPNCIAGTVPDHEGGMDKPCPVCRGRRKVYWDEEEAKPIEKEK